MRTAWFAGLLDGEGCVHIKQTNQGKSYVLMITIANTNFELMQFLVRIYGGAFQKKKLYSQHHKVAYNWSVQSKKAMEILTDSLPYLIVKRQQAELGILFQTQLEHKKTIRGEKARVLDSETSFREECFYRMHELNRRGGVS